MRGGVVIGASHLIAVAALAVGASHLVMLDAASAAVAAPQQQDLSPEAGPGGDADVGDPNATAPNEAGPSAQDAAPPDAMGGDAGGTASRPTPSARLNNSA